MLTNMPDPFGSRDNEKITLTNSGLYEYVLHSQSDIAEYIGINGDDIIAINHVLGAARPLEEGEINSKKDPYWLSLVADYAVKYKAVISQDARFERVYLAIRKLLNEDKMIPKTAAIFFYFIWGKYGVSENTITMSGAILKTRKLTEDILNTLKK